MVHVDGEIGVVPVEQRIIKADPEPLGAESLDEGGDEVASMGRVGRLVLRDRTVPQAEALMVLGGQHHIFHAGGAGAARPLARRVEVGVEMVEIFPVGGGGDLLAVLQPFVPGAQRVEAPMDEQAEAGVGEPRLLRLGEKQFRGEDVGHAATQFPNQPSFR